jgi:alpha-tubulin suppressor-like RCC1 family protein
MGFTCAVVNGSAKCSGTGWEGELGNGVPGTNYGSVQVTGLTSGVTAIVADEQAAYAIQNGNVFCWGLEPYGNLGDGGVNTERNSPVAVNGLPSGQATALAMAADSTCALLNGGSVQCWGWNSNGQLGNGATFYTSTPQQVTGLTSTVTGISARQLPAFFGTDWYFGASCAVFNGGVQCWGNNDDGVLGQGSNNFFNFVPTYVTGFGALSGAQAVSMGSTSACAINAAGGILCWGRGDSGQRGDGTFTYSQNTPQAVSGVAAGATVVSCGGGSDCCAVVSGAIECWGFNGNGNLGNGTTTNSDVPVTAVAALATNVSAGGGTAFYKINLIHSCGVVNGGVQCWGSGSDGQLGNSANVQHNSPVNVTGLGAGSGVTQVSAGYTHTCALIGGTGAVWCWGDNSHGELGNNSTTNSNVPVSVSLAAPAVYISAGAWSTCAVLNTGAVQCWGQNNYGQLQSANLTDHLLPYTTAISGATQVTVGGNYACALVSGGMQCWGWNGGGQLGTEALTYSLLPVTVF